MRSVLVLILLSCFAEIVGAQSLRDLQDQKRSADREMAQMNEQLNATKKEKNSTMKQVTLVHSMILKRKKIIENIDIQVGLLTKIIGVKTDTVSILRNDITSLKKQYAKTLAQAYKLRNSTSAIALVLASSDLQMAIRRMKYLRSYSDFRMEQANNIEKKQVLLGSEIADLNQKKRNLQYLLVDKNKEVAQLATDEKNYQNMLEQLKGKEKDLMKEIQKRRQLSDRLNREINALIAEEARKATEAAKRKAAEEAARKKAAGEKVSPPKSKEVTKEIPFTPEDRLIAGKFEANRGRLPWPVKQGQIVESFGEHMHPILKSVKVKNDGVDIASVAGSEVTAVYDGVVSKSFTLPGANITLLVRHGYYITVYSNLSRVLVQVGQTIKAKQPIGILANSDTGSEKPTLKFQIWKETTPQNPEHWLVK